MRKNVLMCLAVAAFLVSCSRTDVDPIPNGVQVKLSGVLNTGAGTRGDGVIENDDVNTTKPANDLPLSIYRANYAYETTYFSNFTGTFLTTGEIDMTPTQYYLADGTKKSKFIAVYPPVADDKYNEGNKTLEFPIDGTDIVASQLVEGSKGTPISTPMEFEHLLTQIQVSVVADPAATAEEKAVISQQIWGKVISITLTDKAGTGQVTLPAPTADAGTKVTPIQQISMDNLPLIPTHNESGGLTIPTDDNPDLFGYAMFVPVVGTLTLVIETAGGTTTKTTSSLSPEAGNAYAITIKFLKGSQVVVEGGGDGTGNTGATLVPWVAPTGTPKQVEVDDVDHI